MKLTPCSFIYSPILFAMSWSNPLRRMDLTITVTSNPRPARNPAHSKATQEAPTTRVFPGQYGREKRSSLEKKKERKEKGKESQRQSEECIVLYIYLIFFCKNRTLFLLLLTKKNLLNFLEVHLEYKSSTRQMKRLYLGVYIQKKRSMKSLNHHKNVEGFSTEIQDKLLKKVGVYFPSETCFEYFAANFSS